MRILVIILIAVSSICSFAQDTIVGSIECNQIVGVTPSELSYKDGSSLIMFNNGYPNYYLNGLIDFYGDTSFVYQNSKPFTGVLKYCDKGTETTIIEKFENGLKNGSQKYYEGSFNGLVKNYYEFIVINGKKKLSIGYGNGGDFSNPLTLNYKAVYQEGKLYSETEYWPKGNIAKITHYKDGIKHGERREYYPNGDLKGVINYISWGDGNGHANHGFAVYYNEDGSIHSSGLGINKGDYIGSGYKESTRLKMEKQSDSFTIYHLYLEDGSVYKIIEYDATKPLEAKETTYNSDGVVINTIQYENGQVSSCDGECEDIQPFLLPD